MIITGVEHPAFRTGDEVVLTSGSYAGTLGTFVRFKDDVNWAEIKEHNGAVRCHPVTWMGALERTHRSNRLVDPRLGD
jgi:hypothetical protein